MMTELNLNLRIWTIPLLEPSWGAHENLQKHTISFYNLNQVCHSEIKQEEMQTRRATYQTHIPFNKPERPRGQTSTSQTSHGRQLIHSGTGNCWASGTQDCVQTDSERIKTEKVKQSWCPGNPWVKPTAARAAGITIYRLAALALIRHINCSELKSLNEIFFPRTNNNRLDYF